jgi:hypothetical protein
MQGFKGVSRSLRSSLIGRLTPVLLALAVVAPAAASPASDAAYEAGRRHVQAREYGMGLTLLGKAAAADPDSSSGHRARLLQILVLNAHVGRCLSALTSYDRGLQDGPAKAAAALRAQREAVAAQGYAYLRQLLLASEGYRRHVPPRSQCVLDLPLLENWSLPILNAAEAKIESGRPLSPSEQANYQRHALRLWFTMSLSQFYCRPGRDDQEVIEKVQAAMRDGEPVDPWIVLSTTVDTLAAVVNRSLLDDQMGRARVVHHELRSCVCSLLLQAPEAESIVARTKAEVSVKQVFGPERGGEWFRDLEFATRLVKARQ